LACTAGAKGYALFAGWYKIELKNCAVLDWLWQDQDISA
jgi:hypothetical protein